MALAFVPSPSVTVPRSEPYAARNRHRCASNYVVGYSHTKSTTRPPFAVPKAALKDFGRLDLLDKVYGSERTFAGELYVRALPGPLQYLPSFLVPGTLALSAAGAAFGPGILEAIANYLPAHQVIREDLCHLKPRIPKYTSNFHNDTARHGGSGMHSSCLLLNPVRMHLQGSIRRYGLCTCVEVLHCMPLFAGQGICSLSCCISCQELHAIQNGHAKCLSLSRIIAGEG